MQKILILVGPTGVGKTSLSIELAKHFHGEIISGDSMQVYKEMTIGTAKVTKDEADGIPHYLVDEYEYTDDYNVKIFQERARAYIEDIASRGKLPIIVGGTGLYIKSLYYDYVFEEEEVDEEFQAFLKSRSDEECYAMLQLVDKAACENIHMNNRKRVERALMRAHTGEKKSDVEGRQSHQPMYDGFVMGLTTNREELYQRIDQRVLKMMDEGLEEEVRALFTEENSWNLQSLQGIGYKEWKDYFLGKQSKEETIRLIQRNSRQFAKRQYTWFNHQMNVNWFDITELIWKDSCLKQVEEWMGE